MKICPITYDDIKESEKYSQRGLRQLSPALKELKDLPFTADELRQEAESRSSKMSIQGVQPKLSAALAVKENQFQVVDSGGRYILKPQVERYKYLPENEDLTMRLASIVAIEVPLHGLVDSKDGSRTYFIRRFDRKGQKGKLHVEDFAQLSGASRETKYDSSMERVAEIIETFCTFPAVEKLKLFERTVFSFLVGNEDMHLKNFSLIVRNDKVELSPAYDLVNSTMVIRNPKEELALPIRGKRNKISQEDLLEYFAMERMGLPGSVCDDVLRRFKESLRKWEDFLNRSFLPKNEQQRYLSLIQTRATRLGIRTPE